MPKSGCKVSLWVQSFARCGREGRRGSGSGALTAGRAPLSQGRLVRALAAVVFKRSREQAESRLLHQRGEVKESLPYQLPLATSCVCVGPPRAPATAPAFRTGSLLAPSAFLGRPKIYRAASGPPRPGDCLASGPFCWPRPHGGQAASGRHDPPAPRAMATHVPQCCPAAVPSLSSGQHVTEERWRYRSSPCLGESQTRLDTRP